ncbi:MAG: hypothetical protein CMH50_07870 [Myxococcales bacterium]|nr:hypothetical protein [Myxococcales bacterium]
MEKRVLAHVQEWVELLVRWFHVIVGAAWIGTSFYFNWLNNNVRPPEEAEEGVGGEVWAVHGGGFYRVVKYKEAPPSLPGTLHWFKWEAYLTWVSGVSLLFLVYYFGADGMLIDPDKSSLSKAAVIGIGLGSLVGGWLTYDLLCKSPLRHRSALLTAICFTGITAVAYGLVQVMGSRAAYIHVGAMIGTCMAANVFFVIIPGQRAMVDAMAEGEQPDASRGRDGALRSLHNNYFTLPVLFIMVSSHYPMTYGHRLNWALLAGISLAGACTRHWFNLRGQGHRNRWLLPVAAVLMVGLAFVSKPKTYASPAGGNLDFYQEVYPILQKRCVTCHAAQPTFPGYLAPPGGVILETPEQIKSHAAKIMQNAVNTPYMPPGNLTKITEEERSTLGQWVQAGAKIPKAMKHAE